jgi:transaldolase
MRPAQLSTKIFLDSGDPAETDAVLTALGYLDGQTTNPTLIAKHPEAKERLERGEQFTSEELLRFYKEVVQILSKKIPVGSISIEVYADATTTAEQMFEQGREMFSWIPNAHVKLPITAPGLTAATELIRLGVRVNMTLCFTQAQAAAVYAATRGAVPGQVFVSPFVGRLDDQGQEGMSLVRHILQMYASGDGHVEVLAASVRTQDHLLAAIQLKSPVVTAPAKVYLPWAQAGQIVPDETWQPPASSLSPIPYEEMALDQDWKAYPIQHPLTTQGMEKFSQDWNALIQS